MLADDIFQNTFLKVLGKAHTFKPKNEFEVTNISSDIKAWLSRIARNELINFLRKNPDEQFLSNSKRVRSSDLVELLEERSESETILGTPTIQLQTLEKGLSSLSNAERTVLMTYMLYYDPQMPNKHLPDEVLENLCKTFKQKPGGIRQLKLRALRKIKQIKDESF